MKNNFRVTYWANTHQKCSVFFPQQEKENSLLSFEIACNYFFCSESLGGLKKKFCLGWWKCVQHAHIFSSVSSRNIKNKHACGGWWTDIGTTPKHLIFLNNLHVWFYFWVSENPFKYMCFSRSMVSVKPIQFAIALENLAVNRLMCI